MIAGARGRRVLLRAPRLGDREEFLRLNRASRGFYRGLVMPAVTSRQWAAYLTRRRRPESPGFLICRVEDGAIVGGINVNEIVRGVFKRGYLGYQIGAPYGAPALHDRGACPHPAHRLRPVAPPRVEANIQPRNRASIALVRRAGFRREGLSPRYLKIGGRWRDHERWALTVEDWRRRRPRARRPG